MPRQDQKDTAAALLSCAEHCNACAKWCTGKCLDHVSTFHAQKETLCTMQPVLQRCIGACRVCMKACRQVAMDRLSLGTARVMLKSCQAACTECAEACEERGEGWEDCVAMCRECADVCAATLQATKQAPRRRYGPY